MSAADALLLALHLTHRKAPLLFAMLASHTDAQIADALRQGHPHLTDPDYLQDRRSGQQSDAAKRMMTRANTQLSRERRHTQRFKLPRRSHPAGS